MTKQAEGSQSTNDDPKDDEKIIDDGDVMYPKGDKKKEDEKVNEDETAEEKVTRELGERAEKVGLAKDASEDDVKKAETKSETATKELNDRAEKVGLKEGATEVEIKAAETKAAEADKPTVTELHDKAISAVEKWQADPTPANKKLADEAVAEAKEAVEAEKKSVIKYDVKLPEKTLLPENRLEEIVAYARERGFSNEVAQSMVDRENQAVMAYNAGLVEQVDKLVLEDWPEAAADDKEIGGDDFGKNAELAKRLTKRFASDELNKLLLPRSEENPDGKGFGNHPEFIRFALRIGKSMSDDQLVIPKDKGGPGEKKIEDVFYGDEEGEEEKDE